MATKPTPKARSAAAKVAKKSELHTVAIYALRCPVDGAIRYVGKANDPEKRLKSHLRDSRRRSTPVYCWIRMLTAQGMSPGMQVLEIVAVADWPDAERRLIAAHAGPRLLNLAEGGDEPLCNTETRAANGRANAKLVHGDPVRRRLWELKRSMGQYLSDLIKENDQPRIERQRFRMRELARKHPNVCAAWANV